MPVVKIRELKPGMQSVEVEGMVLRKEIVAYSPKLLAKALISDGSGEVILNLWRNQVNQADVGDTIKVSDGFVKTWGGKLELSTWKDIIKIKLKDKR